jgi:outer membrane protein TolC
MRKCLVIALWPFWLCAQTLGLAEAVEFAEGHNEKIRQYSEQVQDRRHQVRASLGQFAPNVKLSGSVNHLNDDMVIDLSPIRSGLIDMQSHNQVEFANMYNLLQARPQLTSAERAALLQQYSAALGSKIPVFAETFKEKDYYSATVSVVQPLFLGGKLIAANQYAKAEQAYSKAELEKIRHEVAREVEDRYITVSFLQHVIATRRLVLAGMQQHERQAQRLLAQGLIAHVQLLRAQVAVAEAERNLHDDLNRLDIAMLALRQTMAWPEESALQVSDSLRFTIMPDSATCFADGSMNQPLLTMVACKERAAVQGIHVARSAYLPEVAAFGKYEMAAKYLSALEPRWAIGAQASITLFDGFRRHQNLQSAKSVRNQVQALAAQTQRQIDLWKVKAFREANNAHHRYLQMASHEQLAGESVRLYEKRFETGLSTSLEVIDSRLVLEKIILERTQSLFDFYHSMADFYVATGHPQDFIALWTSRPKSDSRTPQ